MMKEVAIVIKVKNNSRELAIGALLSAMRTVRHGVSPVELTFQGTSASSAGCDARERVSPKTYGDLIVSKVRLSRLSTVAVPSSKGPLSGVPAWSPPVL